MHFEQSLRKIPTAYEITHFAAGEDIASASTRYASIYPSFLISHVLMIQTLTAFSVQLPILLPGHQRHDPRACSILERLQPRRGNFNVRRSVRRLGLAIGGRQCIGKQIAKAID